MDTIWIEMLLIAVAIVANGFFSMKAQAQPA